MAIILGWDLETTSLDVKEALPVEMASVLWDTDLKRAMSCLSVPIDWSELVPSFDPSRTAEWHGLTLEALKKSGVQPKGAVEDFFELAKHAEFIVGHNAVRYDREVLRHTMLRIYGADYFINHQGGFTDLKWMDTTTDLPLPENKNFGKLAYMCLDHGYIMNNAHQALADVMGCLHLVSCYDFGLIREIASTPYVTVSARVKWDDWCSRDKLKSSRFYWNANKKCWEKHLREYWVRKLQHQLEFDFDVEH